MAGLAAATAWGALELVRRLSNYGKKVGLSLDSNSQLRCPNGTMKLCNTLRQKKPGD